MSNLTHPAKSVRPVTAATHDVMKFDRRHSIRLPMTGVAMATFALADGGTVLSGVEIVDTSASGLGIRCPVEVKPGTRFSLFPDKGNWQTKSGIVSRCAWDGEYYRCGLNLAPLAMAA